VGEGEWDEMGCDRSEKEKKRAERNDNILTRLTRERERECVCVCKGETRETGGFKFKARGLPASQWAASYYTTLTLIPLCSAHSIITIQ